MKKNNIVRITCVLVFVACMAIVFTGSAFNVSNTNNSKEAYGKIPEVKVKFAMEPYPDHTDGIIAVKKGWFKEVGIDLKWSMVDADKVSSVLVAGTADIASAGPSLLIPSMKQMKFQNFVMGGLFQGYAIMAQPDKGYKSFSEFTAKGLSPAEAIKAVMNQMKGKVFAYPPEAAIKPFIDLCFSKGDMSLGDVVSEVQQDSNAIALMLAKRADFQVGGVPSRITLQGKGMKPIISSAELLRAAKPTSDSEDIRSISHNGWTTTKAYADKNLDTLLRMASVRFRLNQFMKEHRAEAISIHIPFLNQQSGSNFSTKEGMVIYSSLIPVSSFEEQKVWFEDKNDPTYWRYELESVIKLYESQDMFAKGQFKGEDISMAPAIYAKMKELKGKAEQNLSKLQSATGQTAKLRNLARHHYNIFNYLDAARFSEQAMQIKK